MFSVIEEGLVIPTKGGVFRQVKVYEHNNYVFAAYGTGFIRLCKDGRTSVPDIRHEELYVPFETQTDPLGRLLTINTGTIKRC